MARMETSNSEDGTNRGAAQIERQGSHFGNVNKHPWTCWAVLDVLGVALGSPLLGGNFTCISEPQRVEYKYSPIG